VYKIAIAGASTLLGRELKDALSESPLAAAALVLLDDDPVHGQLDQVGDEVTIVQAIDADAFERMDFTFFAGSEDLTRKHWRQALRPADGAGPEWRAGQETGVLVRAPLAGFGAVTADLFTPAVVPADPAALALALILERLQQARAGAVCRRDGAGAGQRVWARRHGRAAPADGEPAELPGHAALNL